MLVKKLEGIPLTGVMRRGEDYAAIATAVHLYLNDTVHDAESGFVTIVRKESGWNDKSMNFRKLPRL